MKLLALLAVLLLTGCVAPQPGQPRSFTLLSIEINAQIGGSRTDPAIDVYNKLAEGAIQSKDLPIDYSSTAPTKVSVTP